MKHTYKISGMTCNGCVASVKQKLAAVAGVQSVEIDLPKGEAEIAMEKHLAVSTFKAVLPEKYTIEVKDSYVLDSNLSSDNLRIAREDEKMVDEKTKLQQLKPLLLIFAYLFTAAFLLNYSDWNTKEAMLDFMGLFYIVFSFFKFLDLKGFPESFRMYDPLAKAIPVYGWIYPFLELSLGLLFLMRFQVTLALVVTILILGITTFGVVKTLVDKKTIRCACLGTALQLPMTEATFIENSIMLVMAVAMLV